MEDTKHSAAQVLPPRASNEDSCGVWNTPLLYFVHSVNRCAQFDSSKLSLAKRARAVQTAPQCNSPAATYTSACETPLPRRNKAELLRV